MRRLAVSLLLLSAVLPAAAADGPNRAPTGREAGPLAPPQLQPVRLEKLFGELKRERNEKAAQRIAGRISGEWARSGSDTVDLMVGWARKGIEAKNWGMALDFLDQVTVLKPDYAEGWNMRATVHFMMNNYSKSMTDIERTLELEPRHFGALSGLAMILKNTGHKESALAAYGRVLAVYPMNRQAQEEVATLSDELAGEGI